MDRKLLDLLVCPRTHQPLEVLDARGLELVNASIAGGSMRRIDGAEQREALREALITRDRQIAYRVDDGIPVLLGDEGLPVTDVLRS